MASLDYDKHSHDLVKAIDVAIESLQKFPPKNFDHAHLDIFVNSYEEFRKNASDPDPKFRNLKSLSYVRNDVFTYFQEGHGNAVNYFWSQVKSLHLPFKRENKLEKILKAGRIKKQSEYDFIIDVLVPYQQEGLLNKEDVMKLNNMIASFETVGR